MHGLMLLTGRSISAKMRPDRTCGNRVLSLLRLATIVASAACVVGAGGGTVEPMAMRQNDPSLLLRRMEEGNSGGGMSQEGEKWREEGMLPLRLDGGFPRRPPNSKRRRTRIESCPHPVMMLRLRGGGRPIEGGKRAGVMDRVWASLKSILSARGRGSPSGAGIGGGDGGGGASSKTNKGQDGTKKQWDLREAGEQARKNKIAKEEEKVKNEIERMMSRHPEFSNKASSFVEGPLESRNEEFERSEYDLALGDKRGYDEALWHYRGDKYEWNIATQDVRFESYLELGFNTSTTHISVYHPIMALEVSESIKQQALDWLGPLVLTAHRPNLSILRHPESKCHVPVNGRVLIFLNQTTVRSDNVSDLPLDPLQLILDDEPRLHAFCIPNTWYWDDWPKLRQFGCGIFVRPINFTALQNVSLDLLWQVGVPTHTAHVLPWRRAAGLADGSMKGDHKAFAFGGGDDDEGQTMAEEEVLELAGGSSGMVTKITLMQGYGPQPANGDTCLVQYAAWPLMALGPEDVVSSAIESPIRVHLGLEGGTGGRCEGIMLLNEGEGGTGDGGIGAGGDEGSVVRFLEEAMCACLPTMKVGELVNVTHYSGCLIQMQLVAINMSDISGDGGVLACFTRDPDKERGDSRGPGPDDEVFISFEMFHDGDPFGRSPPYRSERVALWEPDTFLLDGMRCALLHSTPEDGPSMRVGSRAFLTLEPDYAFPGGYFTGAPPGERIDVHMTLHGWNKVYNVSSEVRVKLRGRGAAIPRGIEEADGDTNSTKYACTDGCRVRISVFAYCHDVGLPSMPWPPGATQPGKIRELRNLPEYCNAYGIKMPDCQSAMHQQMGEGTGMFHEATEICTVLGDGDLPAGLEAGVEGLTQGSECKITALPNMALIPEPYGGWEHDPMENPFPVSYMVKLKEVTPRSKQRTRELIESAARRRRRGNQCYSKGRYDEAQSLYESSLSIVDLAKGRVDVEGVFMDEVSEAERACLLNMAACLQRMGRYREVETACTRVLDTGTSCDKALFRRSQARVSLGDDDGARQDLQAVSKPLKSVSVALKRLELRAKDR